MMKKEKHCFIIQKKVMAIDAKDAIKKEKDGWFRFFRRPCSV